MPENTIDDLNALFAVLPANLRKTLTDMKDREQILEIVMDLGRLPEARFPAREVVLSNDPITAEDLAYVVEHIGQFGGDNRAGIERTLHRISAIRNRRGEVVGLDHVGSEFADVVACERHAGRLGDPAPVGIAAEQRRLHQRRVGDRAGDPLGLDLGGGLGDLDPGGAGGMSPEPGSTLTIRVGIKVPYLRDKAHVFPPPAKKQTIKPNTKH